MLLLIDKPKGISSHDVVNRVRKITGIKKVGHGGTLDPNATGLLIIGVGRESTKKLGNIAKDKDKTYLAEITLGEERDTDDIEGEVVVRNKSKNPALSQVKQTLVKFSGKLEQIPPVHSAIKIKGKKSYELARKGKEVKLSPRKVTIYSYKLIKYNYPIIEIEFEVSSGTYIRALARDIGRALGTYAYLSNLRRTKIGEYDIKDAKKIEDLYL